ncbi:hypothetical protein A2U01_0073678, partial [Trifolium medium]|nr:hypothetical protein [Trifolium medium]
EVSGAGIRCAESPTPETATPVGW